MHKENFDEKIQLSPPTVVPRTDIIDLKTFYNDNKEHSFWLPFLLEPVLSLIPKDYQLNDKECEIYLPVNKKAEDVLTILSHIGEQVINLKTEEGKKEAGKRFAILSYLFGLEKNPKKSILHSGGASIHIGYFMLPDGTSTLLSTYFSSDRGEHGSWWFSACGIEYCVNSSFWFAFSPELKNLINSKY